MSEKDNRQELRRKLIRAKDIEEVRAILGPETTQEEIDQVWREIEAHRPTNILEEVDDDELEAVSGGADRDWEEQDCSSTTKEEFCWMDDWCDWVIIGYTNYNPCDKGGHHEWYLAGSRRIVQAFGLIIMQQDTHECRKCHKQRIEGYRVG